MKSIILLLCLIVLFGHGYANSIVYKTPESRVFKNDTKVAIGNTWSPNNVYFTGQLNSASASFFSGILLKSYGGDVINQLQFHLEARPLNENTNLENTVSSLIVLLVVNRAGNMPKSSDIAPSIPGTLPWNGNQQVPIGFSDFTQTSGPVYRYKGDVIYGETFYPNNQNMTGCCRYITRYMMHTDPRIDYIKLDVGDELMVLLKYGSQDVSFKGFQFSGHLNWEHAYPRNNREGRNH